MDDELHDAVINIIDAGRLRKVETRTILNQVRRLDFLRIGSDMEVCERLLKILKQLVRERRLRRLPPKKYWEPATGLPPLVYALRPKEDAAKRKNKQRLNELRQKTPWVPMMAPFAYKLAKKQALDLAVKINEYLRTRKQDEPKLPHRERALRIFGDEKALEGYIHGGLFKGKITLEDLDCFYCPEPLPFHSFSLDQRKTEGKPLLVVENANTYWSCCRANETLQLFAAVVYGRGNAITSSKQACDDLREIEKQMGSRAIFYFGDLDPEGIDIPNRINQRRHEMGLPSITAAHGLYRTLLRINIMTPCKPFQHKKHDSDLAKQWLGEKLADLYLQKAPQNGWPQEGLTVADIIRSY